MKKTVLADFKTPRGLDCVRALGPLDLLALRDALSAEVKRWDRATPDGAPVPARIRAAYQLRDYAETRLMYAAPRSLAQVWPNMKGAPDGK